MIPHKNICIVCNTDIYNHICMQYRNLNDNIKTPSKITQEQLLKYHRLEPHVNQIYGIYKHRTKCDFGLPVSICKYKSETNAANAHLKEIMKKLLILRIANVNEFKRHIQTLHTINPQPAHAFYSLIKDKGENL